MFQNRCCTLWLAPQLCPTLCDPMDCSPPGSSVHGDSPNKNTGVGCHIRLQGILPTQGMNPGLLHCRWILYHLSHQAILFQTPGDDKFHQIRMKKKRDFKLLQIRQNDLVLNFHSFSLQLKPARLIQFQNPLSVNFLGKQTYLPNFVKSCAFFFTNTGK